VKRGLARAGLSKKYRSQIAIRAKADGTASGVLSKRSVGDTTDQLKARTMRFALAACALIKQLPREEPGPTVKRQLAKAATGVAFNHRSSCRSRSHTEFTARIGVVAEEADEAQGWLEFIVESRLIAGAEAKRLFSEATELSAIFSASYGTARERAATERQQRRRTRKSRDN
jgi:four helix bundle protein